MFVLTAHHIVCDGWSSSVLFSDLGSALRGGLRRHPGAARARGVVRGIRRGRRRARTWSPRPRRTRSTGRRSIQTERRCSTSRSPEPDPPRRRTAAAASTCGSTTSCTPRSSRPGRDPEPRCSRRCSPRTRCSCYRLSGQSDFVVGIPFAGQPQLENSDARRPLREHRPAASAPRPGRPVRRAPSHRP